MSKYEKDEKYEKDGENRPGGLINTQSAEQRILEEKAREKHAEHYKPGGFLHGSRKWKFKLQKDTYRRKFLI